jgi:hypothetical protein
VLLVMRGMGWVELNGCLMLCSAMPEFHEDRKKAFAVSTAEWHHLAYHNSAKQVQRQLEKKELAASGFDVRAVEAKMPTAKTCCANRYCDRIREMARHFEKLYAHYQQMRPARWRTYWCEQRALHTLCMRVKGEENRKAKKSDVVVAFGAARFGSSMRGCRAAPVRKILRYLRRYVTIVMVDEHRTSLMCSHGCALKGHLPPPGGGGGGEERKRAEERAIQGR